MKIERHAIINGDELILNYKIGSTATISNQQRRRTTASEEFNPELVEKLFNFLWGVLSSVILKYMRTKFTKHCLRKLLHSWHDSKSTGFFLRDTLPLSFPVLGQTDKE